jgi:hypothetical protein
LKLLRWRSNPAVEVDGINSRMRKVLGVEPVPAKPHARLLTPPEPPSPAPITLDLEQRLSQVRLCDLAQAFAVVEYRLPADGLYVPALYIPYPVERWVSPEEDA